MSGDREPPGSGRPGATASTGPFQKPGITKPTNQVQPIAVGRQCRRNTVGRHAQFWRDGFLRGRVDALRVAMRHVDDLDTLAILIKLADDYELAAGDS